MAESRLTNGTASLVVPDEKFRQFTPFAGIGIHHAGSKDALDVKAFVKVLKKGVGGVLGRAVGVAEHPFYVAMPIELTAKIRKIFLAVIVEIFLEIGVEAGGHAQRTIGWVEVEEVLTGFVNGMCRFPEIAVQNLHIVSV